MTSPLVSSRMKLAATRKTRGGLKEVTNTQDTRRLEGGHQEHVLIHVHDMLVGSSVRHGQAAQADAVHLFVEEHVEVVAEA